MLWFIVTAFLVGAAHSDDYMKRFIGAQNLQIGYGKDCHLFWKSSMLDYKKAEFRCGTKKGDPIQIVEAGNGHYYIQSGDKGLQWFRLHGIFDRMKIKKGFFTHDYVGDEFWIRRNENGLFSIGFDDCPLTWKSSSSKIKNAEFRCGYSPPDLFWIRGENCGATNVEVLQSGNKATYDGEEIVGIATGGTCDQSSHTLELSQTKEVTEEIGVEMSKTNEVNWQISQSVSVMAGAVTLAEVEATTEVSAGGSISFGSSKSRSTGSSASSSSGQQVTYNTPGAAMVVGFVKRYKFDKSNVPARVTVKCEGGHTYNYDSTIRLHSKAFGHTFFKSYIARLEKEKCNDNLLHCLYSSSHYLTYQNVSMAGNRFNQCFPSNVRV